MRDPSGIICEIAVPIVLVLVGSLLLLIDGYQDPESYILTPLSPFPQPQKVLFIEDIDQYDDPEFETVKKFVENLPNLEESFKVEYPEDVNSVRELYLQSYIDYKDSDVYGAYKIYKASK